MTVEVIRALEERRSLDYFVKLADDPVCLQKLDQAGDEHGISVFGPGDKSEKVFAPTETIRSLAYIAQRPGEEITIGEIDKALQLDMNTAEVYQVLGVLEYLTDNERLSSDSWPGRGPHHETEYCSFSSNGLTLGFTPKSRW